MVNYPLAFTLGLILINWQDIPISAQASLVITSLRYFDFLVGWQGIVLQSPTGGSQKQVARHGKTILNSTNTISVFTNIISAAKPSSKLTRFYVFSDGQITSGN